MVRNLEKAFAEASRLPDEEREALAAWILQELETEGRWAMSFARSEGALADLSDQALREHSQGLTEKLDPDDI